MIIRMGLPTYQLANGLLFRPGDILGRTKFGSIIEHRFLVGYDGEIGHSSGPGEVFRLGIINEVLVEGGMVRVIYPSPSLEETERRLERADSLMGVSWWNMNCHATVNYIIAPDFLVLRAA